MVKNSFISLITQEEKEENKGSVEFQIFSFTNKIRRLTSHLELHKRDFLSQRGLQKILGKRRRMLAYLSKKNGVHYKKDHILLASILVHFHHCIIWSFFRIYLE